MRLPYFDYAAPASVAEAVNLLAEKGPAAVVMAGGTDLVPRLRQRLVRPDVVVSLKNVPGLAGVDLEGVTLKIGARASLQAVMDHPVVRDQIPGLAEAIASIGAPAIQHEVGTLGGNLLLNTRCIHYNQSEWWRSGRLRCHKAGGQDCLAVPESKECSSSYQSDGGVMLAALSAQAVVQSPKGERVVPLSELFTGKGDAPFTLVPGDLLTGIQLFLPPPGAGTAYAKLRWRSAIDYPLASAGAVVTLTKGKVDRVRLALGAAAPQPLIVEDADKILRGQEPSEELIDRAAMAAQKMAEGTVVDNALPPEDYRRRMIRVMARRALTLAVGRAG